MAVYHLGQFTAEEPLTPSGNEYLRYYLVEAADSARVHEQEYRTFYRAKYNEAVKNTNTSARSS